jgi:hypothetical protein
MGKRGIMTPEELVELSAKMTQNFLTSFAGVMKGRPPEEQRHLAALCLGRLLGTAYSTDVTRYGTKSAREFMSQTLLVATGCAKLTGADPDFTIVVIDKEAK